MATEPHTTPLVEVTLVEDEPAAADAPAATPAADDAIEHYAEVLLADPDLLKPIMSLVEHTKAVNKAPAGAQKKSPITWTAPRKRALLEFLSSQEWIDARQPRASGAKRETAILNEW